MKKYYYFFRGNLNSHVDIYLAWANAANEKLNLCLFTIIEYSYYKENRALVNHYRKKGTKIHVVPRILKDMYTFLYFLIVALTSSGLVVHLRKQKITPFILLKKIIPRKIFFGIDVEGDLESEIEYLSDKRKCYKEGFYDRELKGMSKTLSTYKKTLSKADAIFVVSEELRSLLVSRDNMKKEKIHIIPTGFDKQKFYPDSSLRRETRKILKIPDSKAVFVYSGNCYYSWQNLSQTIKIFKRIKNNFGFDALLLLLIRKEDQEIAKEIIFSNKLPSNDFILLSVGHDEMNAYLNASDYGILLRENHMLNKVSTPAKVGEYLAAGLTFVGTKHIGMYSNEIIHEGLGYLLDDIYDINEIDNLLKGLSLLPRERVSNWARNMFSSTSYSKTYTEALEGTNAA